MASRKRILAYLLLNVAVSALTTAGVLWAWQRYFWPQRVSPPSPVSLPSLPDSGAAAGSEEASSRVLMPYQVQPGDSLAALAAAFQTTEEELRSVNGLREAERLGVGQTIYVPVTPTPGHQAAPSPLPAGDADALQIAAIVGAGDLSSEYVQVQYEGAGEISLLGWRLRSAGGVEYTFPALILHGGGAVRVHTAPGTDTVVDLYWGLDSPLWASGDTATLFSPDGEPRSEYHLP